MDSKKMNEMHVVTWPQERSGQGRSRARDATLGNLTVGNSNISRRWNNDWTLCIEILKFY